MKNLSQNFKRLFFSVKCSVCGRVIEVENQYICCDCFRVLKRKSEIKNIDNYYFLYYYDKDIKTLEYSKEKAKKYFKGGCFNDNTNH